MQENSEERVDSDEPAEESERVHPGEEADGAETDEDGRDGVSRDLGKAFAGSDARAGEEGGDSVDKEAVRLSWVDGLVRSAAETGLFEEEESL